MAYASHPELLPLHEFPDVEVHATGQVLRGSFKQADAGAPGSFPILKSKSKDGQTTIQSSPDEHWIPKNSNEEPLKLNNGVYPEVKRMLKKAGHLLVTAGYNTATARMTAVASEARYVGNGWMPVTGLTPEEAKAAAVFINSTAGRLQVMSNAGRILNFPTYSAAETRNIRVPNIKDDRIRRILADCWERTKEMEVPQFRDGECEVRAWWDEAVANAMDWEIEGLVRLRSLLNREPHVRSLGYNQYADLKEE